MASDPGERSRIQKSIITLLPLDLTVGVGIRFWELDPNTEGYKGLPRFIPPLPIRELRELTRHRHTLVRDQTAVSNRIIKLAESANIKLAQVASHALGVSGRAMLRALARGCEDTAKMAELARGPLREKQGQLRRALRGKLTRSQRFVLTELLDQLEQLEAAVARVSTDT